MDEGGDLKSYEFRDPQTLVEEVDDRVRLTPGSAFLALVQHPSTRQTLVSVERLRRRVTATNYRPGCEELCARIRRWRLPQDRPPTHSAVVIAVRRGLCVLGQDDAAWLGAWRYANHVQPVFGSNLIVVTEHGWLDVHTHQAGPSPACL